MYELYELCGWLGLGEASTLMLMRCLISPYMSSSSSDKKAGWSTNKREKKTPRPERRGPLTTNQKKRARGARRSCQKKTQRNGRRRAPARGDHSLSEECINAKLILMLRSSKPARHRRRARAHQHGLSQTSRDAILASDACPSRFQKIVISIGLGRAEERAGCVSHQYRLFLQIISETKYRTAYERLASVRRAQARFLFRDSIGRWVWYAVVLHDGRR